MFNWQAIFVRMAVTFAQAALPLVYVNNEVDLSGWQNAVMIGGAAVLSLLYNLGRQWLDARQGAPNLEGARQDAAIIPIQRAAEQRHAA